ncbi:hypothetical protein MCOR25_010580, partial [Pyricularia grisea]
SLASMEAARKTEAECGSLHVTAPRLGAVFEKICPVGAPAHWCLWQSVHLRWRKRVNGQRSTPRFSEPD